MNNIKKGDLVIFKNIFAILAGRVLDIPKTDKSNLYHVKCVDSTFSISTYDVSANDIIEVVKPINKCKFKKGDIVLFKTPLSPNDTNEEFLTGRIIEIDKFFTNKEVLNYKVIAVNKKFKTENYSILERDIIKLIK